ncbi:MAG: polysaccharide deacetylase family protein [Candidatus Altimarinota bacterium]
MKFKKKYIFIPLAAFVVMAIGFFATLTVMNLRNFQFFGELIDHVETDQKVVALTFDDSPSFGSDQVLQILKEQGIRATFFSIGQNIEKYPEQFQNILSANMEVGNHSYSHQRNVFQSYDFYREEIDKTNQLIRAAGYSELIHFRPPYGKKLFGLPWYLAEQKIKTIMWDVELLENNLSAKQITDYIVSKTKPGSIILMHPFCEMECQAERDALPMIIEQLKNQGYQFLTVSELLEKQ